MSLYCDSEESRPSATLVLGILDGRPWTARSIRNNNLRQHARLLARNLHGNSFHALRPACRRVLKTILENTALLTTTHPSDFQAIPAIVRVAAYRSRWIREPEHWSPTPSSDPRGVLRDLLNHLFVKWPVPEFFHSAWFVRGKLICPERDWYCLLASGGSLHRAAGMPPSITSRALHLAMKAPENLSVRQALRWGQLKAFDAPDEILTAVLSSRIVADLSNNPIWSRLFEKVVAAGNFRPQHFGIIADTLLELTVKGHSRRAASLVDLPLPDLLSHSRRYWRDFLKSLQKNGLMAKRHDIHCPKLRRELHDLLNAHWPPFIDAEPFLFHQNHGDSGCK